MVEQRSPKPLVACSNRVSPASSKSSYIATFFISVNNYIIFFFQLQAIIKRLSLISEQPLYFYNYIME